MAAVLKSVLNCVVSGVWDHRFDSMCQECDRMISQNEIDRIGISRIVVVGGPYDISFPI